MEPVRETWTDERLDDLNHRVDDLGLRMDEGFNSLRTEFNARFDSLQRTMLQFGGALIVALVAGFVGIATQL